MSELGTTGKLIAALTEEGYREALGGRLMSVSSMWVRIFPTGLRDSRYLLLSGFLFGISAFHRDFAHLSITLAGIPLFPGELTLGGLLVLEGARLLRKRQVSFRVGAASWLWALYLCVGIVIALVGLARGFGLAAVRDFALVYYVVLFFLVQSILRAQEEPARIFSAVAIGSVLGSALTTISFLITPRLSFEHAAAGFQALTAWLALTYVAANPAGPNGWPVTWRRAAVLPLVAVIYLSAFRTMVVVAAASLAVAAAWPLLARGPARGAARSLLFAGGGVCLAFAMTVAAARLTLGAPAPGSPLDGEVSLSQALRVVTDRWARAFIGGGEGPSGAGEEASASFRLSAWTNALTRIRAQPWSGIGFGPASALYPDLHCDRPTSPLSNCGNAHNTYLTLAMRMGLPAFALWAVASLWVAGSYFRATLARRADEAAVRTAAFLCAALVSLLAFAFFNLFFESPYLSPFYWVTLGVMAESTRRLRGRAPSGARGEKDDDGTPGRSGRASHFAVGMHEQLLGRRVDVLGVGVNAIDMEGAVNALEGWIARRERTYVCVTPVAGVMACQRDPELRRIFNASGMTTPDGMPIVWFLRLLGHRSVGRVYGPDLLRAACLRSETTRWRHYFYGGQPGVAARLAERLRGQHSGLAIAGAGTPPLDWQPGNDDRSAVEAINAAEPDIVWIGMSTPKQERWMAAYRPILQAPVLVGVGAAFDFISGTKPQAPRWVQRSGLEWLFRLVSEPRRLWRRYLVDNPMFVILVTMQLLGLRRPAGGGPQEER